MTLFSVRFVFQRQREREGHGEGERHSDNVVQQRAGLHDSHPRDRRQATAVM